MAEAIYNFETEESKQNAEKSINPKFKNYNINLQSTVIKQLTYLKFDYFKSLIIAPFLIISTSFIFGLMIYWNAQLRYKIFYK